MSKTPKGQIDEGFGIVKCPRCKKDNFKGALMCGHGSCTGELPKVLRKSTTDVTSLGIDLTKLSSVEAEAYILAHPADEKRIKRAAFDRWASEISGDIRNAPDQGEHDRLVGIRDNTVMRLYNKYK